MGEGGSLAAKLAPEIAANGAAGSASSLLGQLGSTAAKPLAYQVGQSINGVAKQFLPTENPFFKASTGQYASGGKGVGQFGSDFMKDQITKAKEERAKLPPGGPHADSYNPNAEPAMAATDAALSRPLSSSMMNEYDQQMLAQLMQKMRSAY
jgi:hypothetical protein